ncbi:MAG: hypothetical protein ABW019_10300 [Chitinophagaceae bacterium]
MNRYILFSALLFAIVGGSHASAQVVLSVQPTNDNEKHYQFTANQRPPIVNPDNRLPNEKRTVLWCEYGDGGFTTDSLSTSNRLPGKYKTLLLTSTLYDTSRDGLARFSHFDYVTGNRSAASDNDVSLLPAGANVALTANLADIVPGDTMIFAITYKLPPTELSRDSVEKLKHAEPPRYTLVFLYNSAIFHPLAEDDSLLVSGTRFGSIRTAHGETFITDLPQDLRSAIEEDGYDSYIIFSHLYPNRENNLFVTLRPGDRIELGSSTLVKAVLLKIEDNIATPYSHAGEAILGGMSIQKAHDPNYIAQEDRCITTPKDSTTLLKYHIHFQNDGQGDANAVIVKVALPVNLRFSDLSMIKASIANQVYPLKAKKDLNSDSVIFRFDRIRLRGTHNNPNSFSNPNTMGDIYFSVRANSSLADTIYARAAIYFHSASAGTPRELDHTWEEAVYTTAAISYFTNCCDCAPPSPGPNPPVSCKKASCCWWWIAVIIVLNILAWWLIARRKKKPKEEKPGY